MRSEIQEREPKHEFSNWLGAINQLIRNHDPDDALASEIAYILKLLAGFAIQRDPLLPQQIRNREYAESTLIVTAAFGMIRDSAPGIVNDEIADQMLHFAEPAIMNRWPLRAVLQHEQATSILERSEITKEAKAWVDSIIVGSSPGVEIEDILNPRGMAEEIINACDGSAAAIVRAQFPKTVLEAIRENPSANDVNAKLVAGCNSFVAHRSVYETFIGKVELQPLHRGEIGIEYRALPSRGTRLCEHRSRRINRLLLEATFGDMLAEGTYLSTQQLIKSCLAELEKRGRLPLRIVIFAQADHVARVADTVRSELESRPDWQAELLIGSCPHRLYDPESAQTWTRTRDVFVRHELVARLQRLCQRRLKNHRSLAPLPALQRS